MTNKEYLAETARLHGVINRARDQITTLAGGNEHLQNSPLLEPLHDQIQDAINDLIALDRQYFNLP